MPSVLVVGVTGSIGVGKSECLRALEKDGAFVIDADRLGHQVYSPGNVQDGVFSKRVEYFY